MHDRSRRWFNAAALTLLALFGITAAYAGRYSESRHPPGVPLLIMTMATLALAAVGCFVMGLWSARR